jgi:hypothetical protein
VGERDSLVDLYNGPTLLPSHFFTFPDITTLSIEILLRDWGYCSYDKALKYEALGSVLSSSLLKELSKVFVSILGQHIFEA